MNVIGSISAARLQLVQPSAALGRQTAGGKARAGGDNEAALREYRTYQLKNNKFSSGFKTILKNLDSATAALSESGVTSTKDSKTAQVTYHYSDAVKAAKDFVDAYNDTLDYLKKNRRLSGVSDVLKEYKKTGNMKAQLEEVGISVDASGKLTLDEDVMKKVLKEDRDIWGRIMNKSQSSLAVRVSKRVDSYIDLTEHILTKPSLLLEI